MRMSYPTFHWHCASREKLNSGHFHVTLYFILKQLGLTTMIHELFVMIPFVTIKTGAGLPAPALRPILSLNYGSE